MAKAGRPTKLNDRTQEEILELIRQGCPQDVAAMHAGIGEETFYGWCRRGKKARSGKFRDFWDELQKAQAFAEATLVLQLRTHAIREWRANAFLLERRFPDRWKQHKAVEQTTVTPPGTSAPVILQVAGMTPEQLSALSGVELDGMELPTDGADAPDPDAESGDGETDEGDGP